MAHETNPYNSHFLMNCILFLCVAVPLIARVAVRFVTSSSLEVVTRLTTNGGRDVLRYYVCGWVMWCTIGPSYMRILYTIYSIYYILCRFGWHSIYCNVCVIVSSCVLFW